MNGVETLMRVSANFAPLQLRGNPQMIGPKEILWGDAGLTVRTVRGRKMRASIDLFDEVAAALQFPEYFGENWDAFDECIADLSWLPPGAGYVVVITEPDQILLEGTAEELKIWVSALKSAFEEFSQTVALGERWDRLPIPFHVVLAGEDKALTLAADRWSAAGADVKELPE
ncbi:barstar (barnase inhibitor) [Salinibacterium amurskyense]|uniref:Barstar (Barnase inhibitor) n=1 Tax=Salinibacterium amurskyense TaxID=205941 RepID=A0A2M9D2U7_9MICO|nr:barstar family protein [Salinibacterium amurskyense]PJJ78506.1 barstar (barnase inhibitor) [Salinibacterium amurskyense]RLQ80600.1 hypothetical protein D9C83_10325 [Salinibacterium amurskyense]GHD83117.1 hypothetical protein GCM10007394_21670 [Salinibacterium amurskyense]